MYGFALLRHVCEWGLYGLIIYGVIMFLPLAEWMKKVAVLLLVLIALSDIIPMILGSSPPPRSYSMDRVPVPSIIAPERR